MKRLISSLLVLLMLPVQPIFSVRASEHTDAWEQILAIEDSVCARRGGSTVYSAQAFTAALDEITEAILSSPEYVPDSMFQNGDAIYWETTDGMACGYCPSLRARVRNSAIPDAEEPENEPAGAYAVRGGSPGSVDVAVFQPYYGLDNDFTRQYQTEGASLAAELNGKYELYMTSEATVDRIADALETSAVVIFDSHGLTDYDSSGDKTSRANTSYLCLNSGEGLTNEDMRLTAGSYGNYYHAFYAGSSGKMQFYCVDGAAIANHMEHRAPGNMLWSAICLGMATDGMAAPLREKGVEVVYGYSESVTFKADYNWEKNFWNRMKNGATVAEAAAYMKQISGEKDRYTKENPAWPIFVSSEDPYPGKGNVAAAQTVRSSWRLYSPCRLRVTVNDASLGSVTVTGTQISLHPEEGCYYAGYEIISGSAEIVERDSTLYVLPREDCTIRINFAPKPAARLILCTPKQEEQWVYDAFIGATVTLPAASDLSEDFDNSYTFCGWTTAPYEKSNDAPEQLYPAGTSFPLNESAQTLYAVYSFEEETDPVYTLVSTRPREWTRPNDWTGSYVIMHTFDSESCVLDRNGAAIPLVSTGFTVENEKLSQVDERFVFRFIKTEGGYLIARSSDMRFLVAKEDESLTFSSLEEADSALWTPDYIGVSYVHIGATELRSCYLAHSSGDDYFACKKYYQCNLMLYRKEDAPCLYSTMPKVLQECVEHDFSAWEQLVAPSCTQDGTEGRTCRICGVLEQRTLPSPGHVLTESMEQTPTCTTTGRTARIACTVCGFVQQQSEPLLALGHAWDEGTVLREAGTSDPGLAEYRCTRCGANKTQVVSCAASLTCKQDESCCSAAFSDVPAYDHWAHRPIDWAIGNGITTGVNASEFRPNASCTRGQIVTFLWRAAGCPAATETEDPFDDVAEASYCYESVLWAVSQGITTGVTKTQFRPNDVCTRAQIVTFLWRFAGYEPPEQQAEFEDVAQSAYFATAVSWALERGITNGVSADQFRPSAPCTRAQAVAFLYRAICP